LIRNAIVYFNIHFPQVPLVYIATYNSAISSNMANHHQVYSVVSCTIYVSKGQLSTLSRISILFNITFSSAYT